MSCAHSEIVGSSPVIQRVRELIARVAEVDLHVLVTGESGVGKELVARCIHLFSHRKNRPFIKVNCATLPNELIESELFGYEKGAFTGAERRKIGKFDLAEDGSIFLDEIGEIPLPMQAKLLEVLQDMRYPRVGGQHSVRTDARVIAATNRNLEMDMSSGRFRGDLYFRLNTINIVVPPLRDHKEDIESLVSHFLAKHRNAQGLQSVPINTEMMELFYLYHWPGNIRELENTVKSLLVLRNVSEIKRDLKKKIEKRQMPKTVLSSRSATGSINQMVEDEISALLLELNDDIPSLKEIKQRAVGRVEKVVIRRVLESVQWNRKKASRILNISYRTLMYKLKEMDIQNSR